MPDPVTTPSPITSVTEPAQQITQPTGVTLPEKYAGKSAEDIYRAYQELEIQYGKSQTAAKAAEAYSKYGSPEDIQRVMEWAKQADQMIREGQLVQKGQQSKPLTPESAPWDSDDWVLKPEGEKFNVLQQRAIAEAQKYIDAKAGEYGKMIEGIAARDAREKSILVQAIEAARANPNTSIESILSEAADLAKKTPEELIQMVISARNNSPESQEAKLKQMVEARVQEEKQKREAEQLADFTRITSARAPQFGLRNREKDGFAQREAEGRQILTKLREHGINPL